MKRVECSNPTIIRVFNFQQLLEHAVSLYINGYVHEIPANLPLYFKLNGIGDSYSPSKLGVTLETLDNYHFIMSDGVCIPMFMAVPCGKCVHCRHRKAKEWTTRAACETACSHTPPVFFTLTYNNEHLPTAGVNKADIQRFMKRFRYHLTQRFGSELSKGVRYFIVAEYGHNTHRAHYHGILWNLPVYLNKLDLYESIKNAWSEFDYILNDYIPYGYVMVDTARDMTGQYAMKYMRKDCFVPKDKNKCFFLSSRRNGGIGAEYARSNADFYRNHPELLSIQVLNRFDGSLHEYSIPLYFKRMWFPTVSSLIPKDVRDAYDLFIVNYCMLQFVQNYERCTYKTDLNDDYLDFVSRVCSFGYLPLCLKSDGELSLKCPAWLKKSLIANRNDVDFIDTVAFQYDKQCEDCMVKVSMWLDSTDLSEFQHLIELGEMHTNFVQSYLDLHPSDMTLEEKEKILVDYDQKNLRFEIF